MKTAPASLGPQRAETSDSGVSLREQSAASPYDSSLSWWDSKSPEATHPGSIPGPGSKDLEAVEHHHSRIRSRNCFRNAPDFESRALYARTARAIGERVVHGVHVMSVCAPLWTDFSALYLAVPHGYVSGRLRLSSA
jgi:hypothetical protein